MWGTVCLSAEHPTVSSPTHSRHTSLLHSYVILLKICKASLCYQCAVAMTHCCDSVPSAYHSRTQTPTACWFEKEFRPAYHVRFLENEKWPKNSMIYRQVGWVGMFAQNCSETYCEHLQRLDKCMYICFVIVALCAGMTLGYWMLFG